MALACYACMGNGIDGAGFAGKRTYEVRQIKLIAPARKDDRRMFVQDFRFVHADPLLKRLVDEQHVVSGIYVQHWAAGVIRQVLQYSLALRRPLWDDRQILRQRAFRRGGLKRRRRKGLVRRRCHKNEWLRRRWFEIVLGREQCIANRQGTLTAGVPAGVFIAYHLYPLSPLTDRNFPL